MKLYAYMRRLALARASQETPPVPWYDDAIVLDAKTKRALRKNRKKKD